MPELWHLAAPTPIRALDGTEPGGCSVVGTQGMDPGVFAVVFGLAAAVGLARVFGRGRAVQVTSAAALGQVEPGARVRISGIAVELDPPLATPVAAQPCIGYRLVVEEPAWRTVIDRRACARFLLVDAGVSVLIDGPFQILMHADHDWRFGNDVQLRLAQLIAAEGAKVTDPPWSFAARDAVSEADRIYQTNYRYFEALVRPGDRVIVEGFVSANVSPDGERAGLRAPPMRFALTGSPDHPTVVSLPPPASVI
jgi:hypothetical protein